MLSISLPSRPQEITRSVEQRLFLACMGLGLFLRTWQIGQKNFWIDELGVLEAARQPALAGTLKVAYSHIMAMPLDYVVAWLAARVSLTEAWLRLPEVMWGMLTLFAGYQLARLLSGDKRLVLLTLLMLAVSPLLIAYSQELRFYSPLAFFYTAATYLGLRALQTDHTRHWLSFSMVSMLGLGFHLYTILAVGNVCLGLLPYYNGPAWSRRRNHFAVHALMIAVVFLIGLFTFGGVYAEHAIDLFLYESFPAFILTGLGWQPPFPASALAWIPGLLSMALAVLGIAVTLKENRLGLPAILFYSVLLQIGLVIGFNFLKNYFLYHRQLIMLAPLMSFFAATGAVRMADWLAAARPTAFSAAWLVSGVGGLILIATLPALHEYYLVKKGSLEAIRTVLAQHWQSPEPIYVEAGVLEVFAYYWGQDPASPAEALAPLDYASSDGWGYPKPAWLITGYPPAAGTVNALEAAGFVQAYTPAFDTLHPQMLWQRP